MTGGSANGDLPVVLGSMGESTDVASAKRAVLGVLMDKPEEELDEVRALTKTWVFLIFSSGEVLWEFDMLSDLGADVGQLKSYVEGYLNNENQLKHFLEVEQKQLPNRSQRRQRARWKRSRDCLVKKRWSDEGGYVGVFVA